MTKGKGSKFQTKVVPENHTFVNSAGMSFKIQGLPPLMMSELSAGIVRPKKPTYTIVTVSGDVEVHDHDATTLTTDEDKIAWETYLKDFKASESELSNRMLNCILIEGIDIPDETDFTRWEKRQKLIGMPVSEDLDEKILAYKKSTVIRSQSDIEKLMNMVMGLTGVSQEDIEEAKASFPDTVESEP